MSAFKIATWNVNSLRVRLPHVQDWLVQTQPDVLALQETKLVDADFPFAAFHDLGYRVVASGQKTYNGVAIISREEASNIIYDIPELEDPQRRVLCAEINGICVLDIYVPNGQSLTSEKYQYKLNWLDKLANFLKQKLAVHQKIIVLGDFNIAPHEIDVHDPLLWEGQILCSIPERAAFNAILNLGFKDCFRHHTPEGQQFSWWDYRMNAFKRNRGLRIDHILANEDLIAACNRCYIDPLPRSWDRPSDHTPVIAEFLSS